MASTGSLIPLRAIDRTRTSSNTRFGDPDEERSSGDQLDQRSFATGTLRQDDPSLSDQWENEPTDSGTVRPSHLSDCYDEERTSTAAVDQLLPSGSASHNNERNEMGLPNDQDPSTSKSDVVASVAAPCRRIKTRSTMG